MPDNTDQESHVRSLVTRALEPVFIELNTPEDRREQLLTEFTARLLSPKKTSWVEAVGGMPQEQYVLPPVELPKKALTLWKQDKQKGDTPPDFIKRVYGEYLRADGTGLTRAYIRHLDRDLYQSLADWLRSNELPKDCPLPNKRQVTDLRAKALGLVDKWEASDAADERFRVLEALRARERRSRAATD